MNIAERLATENSAGADDVKNMYNAITSKLGRYGHCIDQVLLPDELEAIRRQFSEQSKRLRTPK